MTCKYCGFEIPGNDRFCSNCGAEIKTVPPQREAAESNNQGYDGTNHSYSTDSNNNGYYSQNQGDYYGNNQPGGGFYGGQPAGNPQYGYWSPPVNDKAPKIKEYLKWMLLYPLWNLIPGIGFIIYIVLCIKYALDTTYTARANFFRATLIAQAIGIIFAVLMFIVMFVLMGVGFLNFEELDPSFFMDESYYFSYPAMFIK